MLHPIFRFDRRKSSGFTLVELLVTIAIITVLIGLLLPVISRVRESANKTVCMSNLRQLGVCMVMYTAGNNGYLPGDNPEGENTTPDENLVLVTFATDYVKSPAVFHCPSSTESLPTAITNSDAAEPNSSRVSYEFYSIWWDSDLGPKLVRINGAPLAWDLNGGDPLRSPEQNHGNKGGNVLFTDGHCEWQPTAQWDDANWAHPADQFYLDAGN